jgi:hypothetical protein
MTEDLDEEKVPLAALRLIGAIAQEDPAVWTHMGAHDEDQAIPISWKRVDPGLYEFESNGVVIIRVDVRHWRDQSG